MSRRSSKYTRDSGLAAHIGKEMPDIDLIDGSALAAYGKDEGYARRGESFAPDVVAQPKTVHQVASLVAYADRHGIPVIPWGSGTSLEGQALAEHGGITIDLRGLDRILRILPEDFQVEVEAGITHDQLNERLRREGLFFPPNPGAPATIGGMIANNSSGSKAIKYGVTRDYVQRLEVVLPNGTIAILGNRALKTSSGYDLRHLIIGSEGTLGIVTKAVLRVLPAPESAAGIVARFSNVRCAAAFVSLCIGSGFRPATLELLDERVTPVLADNSPLEHGPGAVLLIECDGHEENAVATELESIRELVLLDGATIDEMSQKNFRVVLSARKSIGWNLVRSSGMRTLKLLDIAVPISTYAEAVERSYEVLEQSRLFGYILGHAGDGNLHVLVASDWRDESLWKRTLKAESDIINISIELEGTITGEHGIGLAKRSMLQREHGTALSVMAAIKHALDPSNIMNPGKVLPADAFDGM